MPAVGVKRTYSQVAAYSDSRRRVSGVSHSSERGKYMSDNGPDVFDVFADTGAEDAPETEPSETVAAKPEADPQPTDDSQISADPDKAEATASDETEKPAGSLPKEALSAVQDERSKRQAIQAELDEARSLLAQFKSLNQPKAEPLKAEDLTVSFDWDDPNKSLQQLQRSVQGELSKIRESTMADRIDLSEVYARKTHGAEYDAAKQAFFDANQGDEAAIRRVLQAQDPAGFIFEEGKRALELAQYGGDMSKRDEAIRLKAVEDYKAQMAKQSEAAKRVPKSLTNESGSAAKVDKETDVEDLDFSKIYPLG